VKILSKLHYFFGFSKWGPRSYLSLSFLPVLLVAALGKMKRIDRTIFDFVDHIILVLPEITFFLFLILILSKVARSIDPTKSKLRSFLIYTFLCLAVINFLILETLGLVYRIATGGLDFDYSLIWHATRNSLDLWPVFEAEFGTASLWLSIIVFILILSAFLRPLKAAIGNKKSSIIEQLYPYAFLLSAVAYLGTSQFYEFPKRAHKTRLLENPLPLSYDAISRSMRMTLNEFNAKAALPIRENYSVNAEVSWLEQKANSTRPNVVLIVLESTGYDKTLSSSSPYPITPFLKKIAEQGAEFSTAFTFIPHTSKSLVAIMCGIEPSLNLPILAAKSKSGLMARCLPSLMDSLGYETLYLSSVTAHFENRGQLITNVGFKNRIIMQDLEQGHFQQVSSFGYEENILIDPLNNWLKKVEKDPFFLTILTLMPHHPYDPPKTFSRKHYSENKQLNGHLNALHYQDAFIKGVFNSFQESGHLKNTVFVIVGDHGESFGKNGLLQHDTVPYDEVLRVPLVFYGPGITGNQKHTNPVSTLDILPTVIDHIGAKFTKNSDGYAGENIFTRSNDKPVYSYCYREKYCSMMMWKSWKYIHYFGYEEDKLFNLATDKDEKHSVIAENPEIANEMREKLVKHFQQLDAYHKAFFKRGTGWLELAQ